MHIQFGGELRISQPSSYGHFPELLLLRSLPSTFWFPQLPFCSSGQKAGSLLNSALPHTFYICMFIWGHAVERQRGRKKQQRFIPPSQNYSSFTQRERFLSLNISSFLWIPVVTLLLSLLLSQDCLQGTRTWRKEQKRADFPLISLSIRDPAPAPHTVLEGFSRSSLCQHRCPLLGFGCIESSLGGTGRRKIPVQWYFKFSYFSSLPPTIYFPGSSNSYYIYFAQVL